MSEIPEQRIERLAMENERLRIALEKIRDMLADRKQAVLLGHLLFGRILAVAEEALEHEREQ